MKAPKRGERGDLTEMEIRAEDRERVVVPRGRLATRPGDEDGRLLVRLRHVNT